MKSANKNDQTKYNSNSNLNKSKNYEPFEDNGNNNKVWKKKISYKDRKFDFSLETYKKWTFDLESTQPNTNTTNTENFSFINSNLSNSNRFYFRGYSTLSKEKKILILIILIVFLGFFILIFYNLFFNNNNQIIE